MSFFLGQEVAGYNSIVYYYFQNGLNASIQELKDDTDITDVTLACDD